TSYRLALKDNDKLFLQGWAVVENTSDEDWNNVQLGLVSGRPISFEMDLYQPLFVRRPTVELELFASLRPQTYAGDMLADKKAKSADGDIQGRAESLDELKSRLETRRNLARRGAVSGQELREASAAYAAALAQQKRKEMNIHEGVASAATTT